MDRVVSISSCSASRGTAFLAQDQRTSQRYARTMSATGTEAPALANDHVQATPVEVPASATARAAAAPPQPPPSGPAAELHAVFPTIDLAVIEAILETHNNDPALCVGDLLAISDPAYTPAAEVRRDLLPTV